MLILPARKKSEIITNEKATCTRVADGTYPNWRYTAPTSVRLKPNVNDAFFWIISPKKCTQFPFRNEQFF